MALNSKKPAALADELDSPKGDPRLAEALKSLRSIENIVLCLPSGDPQNAWYRLAQIASLAGRAIGRLESGAGEGRDKA